MITTFNDHVNIRLEWTAPFNNYLPVTSYETEIVSLVDGLYYNVCGNKSELVCRIPLSVIRTTYGYNFG